MIYNEILQKGSLVYSSLAGDTKLREWRIEERTCSVNYYRTVPLSELELIMLRLVQSFGEKKISKSDLGLTLGFDVADITFGEKRYYKDNAEIALFNNMLDRVIKWNLLKEYVSEKATKTDVDSDAQNDSDITPASGEKNKIKYIRLTRLGQKALEMNCKFEFFSGKKVLYSNINKSDQVEDTIGFPFYNALGFETQITNISQITDYDPDEIDIEHHDELIDRVENLSSTTTNVYAVKMLNEWKYATKFVDVRLYKLGEDFFPLIFKDDALSEEATNILYRSQNKHLFNQKVKKALYYKLINNADSVINYNEIKIFADEVEEDEFNLIIKDKRTDWNDVATYKFIVNNEYCTEKVWDTISQYCPIEVVVTHIFETDSKFDMTSLSRRLPIQFIVENCTFYAWNMNVVMSREDITKIQAQSLMLCETNQNIEWDWDLICDYIDIKFVVENINKLNLDFYSLTSWLPIENYKLIVDNCDKNWNWLLFVKNVDINILISNIKQLRSKVGVYMENILDRIFSDSNIQNLAITSNDFADVLSSCKASGELTTFNLERKDNYVWNDELIRYLEECGVLVWNTDEGVSGFSQYSYVHWTNVFFEKYYKKIYSKTDCSYISRVIDDLSLVSRFQDFDWDWDGLSQNSNFYGLEAFLEFGKDNVRYDYWMAGSGIPFTQEFFAEHSQWMMSDKNAVYVSKSVRDYDIVLENKEYPWIWSVIAQNEIIANDERFCEVLETRPEIIAHWLNYANSELIERYFDKLNLSAFANRIQAEEKSYPFNTLNPTIWDKLSNNLSVQFIENHLSENWNGDTITRRLINSIEGSNAILQRGKKILNWGILSSELSLEFIEKYLKEFKDFWKWDVITERISPKLLHSHFKEYLLFWKQDVAITKIAPLLTVEEIYDPDIANLLDWQVICEHSSKDLLVKILQEKADVLNWDIVSHRICAFEECDMSSILSEAVSSHLNWNIINRSISLPEVLKNKDIEYAKWDWSIITNRFDTDFIINHLQEYSTYWDWDVILENKFDRSYIVSHLESVKNAISQLGSLAEQKCWRTITHLYKPQELLSISETLSPLNGYKWDYTHIYQAINDPDSFINQDHAYVDRTAFSSCEAVNCLFAYDSNTFVFRTWKTIVKSKLNNPKFGWDYHALTRLSSIQENNEVFFAINPDAWDWNYISHYGICLLPEHKGKYMRKYKDRLNFNLISLRQDIGIDDDMICSFIEENWDWHALSVNPKINLSFDFIYNQRDKAWDWSALSKNKVIKWNLKVLKQILKNPNLKNLVSWDDVVSRTELAFDDSVLKLMADIDFSWFLLTGNMSFVPSVDSIGKANEAGKEIDWISLSKNKHIDVAFVREFRSILNWRLVTSNNNVIDVNNQTIIDEFIDLLDWENLSRRMTLNTDILVKYKDFLNWDIVNDRFDYNDLDIAKIESITQLLDWTKVSSSYIVFTEDFLHQYRDKIDWYAFSQNESIDFSSDLYKKDFAKELNRIKFIKTLGECDSKWYSKLKVYHFSHMFNAIDIIKNRKILSRNKAEATKSLKYDAAGSVVHRTNKAHPFARFYFRPKSPTQFYNECLGWDSTLKTNWGTPKSYYPQACGLHLPKCPMPVFFEFDIKEIIAKFPDKCYYSTGNLQTNAASILKVDEMPNRIREEYLYYDISDAKDLTNACFAGMNIDTCDWKSQFYNYFNRIKEQSQQEFLILEELDFSNLKSLRIFCYDEFQKNLLLKYLKDDPIIAKIEVNRGMFSYCNRSLEMTEDDDTITITSDYDHGGCAYFLVKGGTIVNTSSIKNITSSGVIIYPSVKVAKKDLPSEILFIDPNPMAGTKEWLIYDNSSVHHESSLKFDLDENVKKSIDGFLTTVNNLPLSLSTDMFYPHMINSYHGIGHTARVLFLTHLLCDGINLSEKDKTLCCLAAIIHDLGKRSDREGAEHGLHSSALYKDKISEFVTDISYQSRILNAVRFHSVEDIDCPENVREDIIWKVLKDADALDRSRFAGKGCDMSYLRLDLYIKPYGQNIIDLASRLPGWTINMNQQDIYNSLYEQVVKYVNIKTNKEN